MNPILISFGKFEIRWYAVCILVGVLIAFYLINKEAFLLLLLANSNIIVD